MPDARTSENAAPNYGGSELKSAAPFCFSLKALMAAMILVALFVGGVISLAERGRVRAIDQGIRGTLRQTTNALNNYALARGTFPPVTRFDTTGKPLSSWRFVLTPLMERDVDGFAFYDKPWNGEENAQLASVTWNQFVPYGEPEQKATRVFAVSGSGTAFDPALNAKPDRLPPDLVIVMEVADSKTHWMEPGDYDVRKLLSSSGTIGDHLHGLVSDRFHVLFADGEIWALSSDAPMTALHPFLTIASAKTRNRDELLAPHRVD
jgi:hypothetical protein